MYSVCAVLRYFLLAGILANMFFTVTTVPDSLAVFLILKSLTSLYSISNALSLSIYFDESTTSETETIVESASPLKPIVKRLLRSSNEDILLVV